MRILLLILFGLITTPCFAATLLLSEGFEDNSLGARGWFDDTSASISTSTKYFGAGALQISFANTATTPTGFTALRYSITPTEKFYTSSYWRFGSNWVGSGQSYHPHLLYVMSDMDDSYSGLAYNYLQTYIETNNLTPRLEMQDGRNVNTSLGSVPNNLTTTTETRDVSGCNGTLSGSDAGTTDCYAAGGGLYRNGRSWDGLSHFSLSTWHHVETYHQMNTIVGGVAQADGIMWMKVDGGYVVNNTHVVFRTNQHSTMKFGTFVIAPYIGDGSPQAQDMYIDSLEVYDDVPSMTATIRPGVSAAGATFK